MVKQMVGYHSDSLVVAIEHTLRELSLVMNKPSRLIFYYIKSLRWISKSDSDRIMDAVITNLFRSALIEKGMVIKMKFCILMGSPRLKGNTVELLKPFISELEGNHAEVTYNTLQDKNIMPCKGCYHCQNISGEYGCIQQDDVAKIMDSIIDSDCLILATPIYSWYCPAPMKALLDRHYGLNKYYGKAKGSLWEGKKVAILATHGYDAEYGAGPFEIGVKRLCEHSNLEYLGMYSVRDEDDLASFQTEEAVQGARLFAGKLLTLCN